MSCFGRPATRMDICTIIVNPVVHFVRPPVIVYLKLTTLNLKQDSMDTMSINIQVYLCMCIVNPLTLLASILDTLQDYIYPPTSSILEIMSIVGIYPPTSHILDTLSILGSQDYIYPPTSNILDTLSILGSQDYIYIHLPQIYWIP